MKKLIYLGLFLVVLSGLSACTSYNYYVAGLNKTNMSGYHTFAWMPVGNTNAKGSSMIADAKIKDAATMALSDKGLRLQQHNPDLLVSYSTMVGTGTRTNYYPNYGYYGGFYPGFGFGLGWGGGWGGWGGWGFYRPWYYAYGAPFAYGGVIADTEHYKEGTIIIDLIDTRTKQVVWRGFGVGEVHHNPQKNVDDLPKVVDGVLDQLHINPSPGNFRRRGPGPGPARRPGYYPTSNSI
ncbi:MAG: hypothetical protein JWR67_1171 [Mucilaginibacter sp.]|nr:hypothetical protein [Mucilaginibacter sp.]